MQQMAKLVPDSTENRISPGFLLWQAQLQWKRSVDRALKDHDLTYVQYLLMKATAELSHNGQQPTQRQIADVAGCDVNMASQVIRGMMARQLMSRKDSAADTRAKHPKLTSFGEVRLRRAMETVAEAEAAFFESLNVKAADFASNLQELIKTR